MKNKRTIITVVVVVLVLAAAYAAYFIATHQSGIIKAVNDPGIKKVSKKFLTTLRDGKFEDARTYLSSAGQKEYDVEKLKQIKVPALTYETEPETTANEANIVYGDKKEKRYVKLTLVKEDGKWKISNILSYLLNY